ncbi:hypothetical protein SDC9_172603 [bioreactor metagenome]|uniref:Uncharacterized protein n=1 Tax=bioreactor metagenome TaxID=1076179 RepID=A0A645GG93_9ZZZZ
MPYFYDKRINDLSEAGITRRDAVLISLDNSEEADKFIKSTLDISIKYMKKNNPFRLALEAFTDNAERNEAERKMVKGNPDFAKKATVAEEFDNLLVTKFYKMLSYGLLVRANESELENMAASNEDDKEKKEALTRAFKLAEDRLKALSVELEEKIHYKVVPIKKLVAIQLECGLLMADYLKNN